MHEQRIAPETFPRRVVRQVVQHVLRRLRQMRTLADQVVAAARARVERRARHGEQFPPRLLRQPRGDQAAGAQRRFHHDDPKRQAGDDAVAAGEVARLWRRAERRLTHHRTSLRDAALQIGVLGRVGDVETASDRCDGPPRPQCAGVRGGIDAAREPGNHHHRSGQFGSEILRHALTIGRGIASPNQRHRAL